MRHARGRPRSTEGGDLKVFILLRSAWGMGGTVRAAHNLAGYLAQRHQVELISVYRRRHEPFFGAFPNGVHAMALDDQRPRAVPRPLRWLRSLLRGRGSVLYHPADWHAEDFDLWVDLRLVRRLRGETGVLIGTRPGLNMMAVDLAIPGLTIIGEEHMNLASHRRPVRCAMKRRYPRLAALRVLTNADLEAYKSLLGDQAPRLVRIPNTVRAMEAVRADQDAKTILAAGRLTGQKGFGMLISAFAEVSPQHPDWHLEIFGRGRRKADLLRQIDELGLAPVVTLTPAVQDLGAEMKRASVFVLSSRFEGFPMVLLEAMFAGLGVVSFDCPTGPRDVIDDHRTGILVPAGDVSRLAAGLREMIEDDDLRRRCGAAATDTARGYTMAAVGPAWDALLDELRSRSA